LALIVVGGVVFIAAALWLTTADSTYFGSFDSAAVAGPADPGERVYVGLGPFEVKPGDQVRFVSVNAGPAVPRALAVSLRRSGGHIMIMNEKDLAPGDLSSYQILPTTEWSTADGLISLVMEVVMPTTTVTISRPELTFTVNGGPPQRLHFPIAARICLRPASGPFECDSPEPPH
jgi:hypothetical protein